MNLIVIKVINQIIIDFLFFWGGGHSCGLPCVPSLKGRENVQFVSLQHNLIVRIDSLMHFRALMVLNLYDNKIERLSGLDTLKSLRVLMLGKNRCVDRPKKSLFRSPSSTVEDGKKSRIDIQLGCISNSGTVIQV